ncbi:hypothetical protein B7494_g5222 [Chlorociboria aeruginascens]|nr:hypothetical protein B7494_g5222 [Chlorociboria aeruginascens]
MASSQKPIVPLILESSVIGPPVPLTHRHAFDSGSIRSRSASPPLEIERIKTERRLSQLVPKCQKERELVKEEEPWEAKNILSFDGGGIRGLYSLYILKYLMNLIRFIEDNHVDGKGNQAPAKSSFYPLKQPQHASHTPSSSDNDDEGIQGVYLPCHYFDYICGTSTGGLIAIMLGRLRMNIDDCITEYEQLAGSVFGHPNIFHQTFLPTACLKRPKYDTRVLERVIQDVITRRGENSTDIRRTLKTGREICRVRDGHDNTEKTGLTWESPYIFRSYDHYRRTPFVRNPGKASDYPLWEVARATTAAPLYFSPMQSYLEQEIQPPKQGFFQRVTSSLKATAPSPRTSIPVTFIDGGFGPANNPSKEAWQEVNSSNERVGSFVSIGTGRQKINRFHSGLRRFIKAGMAAVGDPEPPHQEMRNKSEELKFGYFRFNEVDGLSDLEFDEWKPRKSGKHTKTKIKNAYQTWALNPEIQESFHRCALELVRRRRLRTADESRWERYAVKAYFDCNEHGCPGKVEQLWYSKNEFCEHLLNDHKLKEENLDNAIQRARNTWRIKLSPSKSTILAAAVIGCFSWQPISNRFWIGSACWYSSLVLSIIAILLSSSQAFIFNALNPPSLQLQSGGDFRRYLALIMVIPPSRLQRIEQDTWRTHPQDYVIRWKMVFTWQAPMMLMSYASLFFLVGLTVYVCTPLFRGEVATTGGKISIFYLATSAVTGVTFILCSFWAYQFIDLDEVAEASSGTAILPMHYPTSSFSISQRIRSTASDSIPTEIATKRQPEFGR